MTTTSWGRVLVPTLLLAALAHPSEARGRSAGLSAEQWREDLSFLAERIRERHRDPFHEVEPEVFERTVAELHEAIPTLAEHRIIAGLARIVALVGDRHTRLTLPVNHDHLGFYEGHSIDPPPAT